MDSKESKQPLSDNGITDEAVTDLYGNTFHRIIMWDRAISATMAVSVHRNSQLGALRPFLKFLEISCHGVIWLLGIGIALLMCHQPYIIELMFNIYLALILDIIVVALLKLLIRRPRPGYNEHDMFFTVSVDKFSFPSGHTTRVTTLVCLFLHQLSPLGPVISAFILTWAVAIGFSRIMLGRHHLLDVLFGSLIGIMDYIILLRLWIPQEKCLELVLPLQEELYL